MKWVFCRSRARVVVNVIYSASCKEDFRVASGDEPRHLVQNGYRHCLQHRLRLTSHDRQYEMDSPTLRIVSIKPSLLVSAWIFRPTYKGRGASRSLLWRVTGFNSSTFFVLRLFTQLELISWEIESLAVVVDTSSKQSSLLQQGPTMITPRSSLKETGTLLAWQSYDWRKYHQITCCD